MRTMRTHFDLLLFLASLVLLAAGAVGWLLGVAGWEDLCWTASTALGVVVSVAWVVGSLRKRKLGVDLIAVLALIGALAVDEPFAGAMITVMLASGRLLEGSASRRAQRDLSLLVERAPRTARRVGTDGVTEVPVAEVRCGDHLLVGPGEVVPVDGHLIEAAVLDGIPADRSDRRRYRSQRLGQRRIPDRSDRDRRGSFVHVRADSSSGRAVPRGFGAVRPKC